MRRARPLRLLTGLATALLVVGVSAAAGAGIGLGLSKLTGDDSTSPVPAAAPVGTGAASGTTPAADAGATGASGASGATGTTDRSGVKGVSATSADATPRALRIKIRSATIRPSATPDGQARQRARVTVRVRVAGGSKERTLRPIRLVVGTESLRADPKASSLARQLLEPVPAGGRATGELRFEVAGAITQRLTERREATLRIAGAKRALRLTAVAPQPPA